MLIEIRPGTLRDITFVAAGMRAEDWREIHASCPFDDKAEAGAACYLVSPEWCWTAWLRDEPVYAAGFAPSYLPWLWSAWAFGTDRSRRAIPAITRHLMGVVPTMIDAGVHRVEARAVADYENANRWLAGLGAKLECELRAFGRNGETFNLWAWTKDDWQRRDDAASR